MFLFQYRLVSNCTVGLVEQQEWNDNPDPIEED